MKVSPSNGKRPKPIGHDFCWAIDQIAQGNSVAREEWADVEPSCYCTMRNEELWIYRNGKWHQWIIVLGDIAGNDWVTRKED